MSRVHNRMICTSITTLILEKKPMTFKYVSVCWSVEGRGGETETLKCKCLNNTRTNILEDMVTKRNFEFLVNILKQHF